MYISLLHGFLGSSLDWTPLLHFLPTPFTLSFTPSPHADLSIGYSMGGRNLLTLMHQTQLPPHPLVLIGVHPGLRTDQERQERLAFEQKWLSVLKNQPLSTFLQLWYEQPLFRGLKEIPPQRFRLQKEEIRKTFQEGSLLRQPPLWGFLEHLSTPLLYIAGEHDLKYRKIAEELIFMNPRIEVAIIKGASHAVHLEKPEEVYRALLDFSLKPISSRQGR